MPDMSFIVFKQRLRIFFFVFLLVYAFFFGINLFYAGLDPEMKGILGFLPPKALYFPPPQNYVTKWEHDIIPLKEKIPAGQARLGYLADSDLKPDSASQDQYIFYDLTQYSLAPIIIDKGMKNEWIILYTSEPKPKAWLDAHLQSPYTIESAGYRFFLIHQTAGK
jgi:hypothetical protein